MAYNKKKEDILVSFISKILTCAENVKKAEGQFKTAPKTKDYTTIADQLRSVSWSDDIIQAGVDKPVYGIPTFPLASKAV